MNPNFKTAMLAAAQLTAAGNLNAATAAIQRALAGDVTVATAQAAGAEGAAATAGANDVIDVQARWLGGDEADSGGADGAGEAGEAGEAASRHPAGIRAGAFGTPEWYARVAGAAAPAGGFRQAWAERQAQADTAPSRPVQTDTAKAEGSTGRMVAGSFTAPAGSRDYLLYLPPGAAAGSGLSLVVMLHGCTQTPADFASGTAMNTLADRHGFIVLYPAQSRTANQSACWNWFDPRDQRADAGEPSIIAGMVREVIERHGVDAARVHVAGLSAGGAMAAILADAYPELFAAVAVHSGLKPGAAHDLPSALSAMKRGAATGNPPAGGGARSATRGKTVRTIVFHGRQDRTVHPLNGRQVAETALAAFPPGALEGKQETGRAPGGRSYTRTVHADSDGKPMVEQWEVQGAGHAWSGGSPAGSYTDPQGPDASEAMVTFFLSR